LDSPQARPAGSEGTSEASAVFDSFLQIIEIEKKRVKMMQRCLCASLIKHHTMKTYGRVEV
jgi:hypothetical protein